MSFSAAVSSVYRNYHDFSGRAGRSEYWWFQAYFLIVYFVGAFAVAALGRSVGGILLVVGFVWILVTLIPQLAVASRRLHDSNKSAGWLLLVFIPFGALILLALLCTDSDRYPNQYGPPPWYVRPQAYYWPQVAYGYGQPPNANPYGDPNGGYQPGYPPEPASQPSASHPLSENQPPPARGN